MTKKSFDEVLFSRKNYWRRRKRIKRWIYGFFDGVWECFNGFGKIDVEKCRIIMDLQHKS